jgi:hypothetical protein
MDMNCAYREEHCLGAVGSEAWVMDQGKQMGEDERSCCLLEQLHQLV